MPPLLVSLTTRWNAANAAQRDDLRQYVRRFALLAGLHLLALGILAWSEDDIVPKLAFLLTWVALNCFWLAVLRRPTVAGALSLLTISLLVIISYFKHKVIWTTATFVDLMVIDFDSINYLFTVFPQLSGKVAFVGALMAVAVALIWRFDSLRVGRLRATAGFFACTGLLCCLEFAFPAQPYDAFFNNNYVSMFVRSGVDAISEYSSRGYLQSDPVADAHLDMGTGETCRPAQKLPHIILVHDESSFDIRVAPGLKLPPGYGSYFRSFDGKERKFIVEGNGGPSWYTEYNVLSGLAARSYGRFAYFVSHIAAGRVNRGLPNALRRCGYQTTTIFPTRSEFMHAKSYQTTVGIENFYDSDALGADVLERDSFFYNWALKYIERDRAKGPMFLYVYLSANHFPWDYRWRSEIAPEWKDLGNPPGVDEYLRRQSVTFHDYPEFIDNLRRKFPNDSFLIVRYGDHQPDVSTSLLEPGLDEATIVQRMASFDPRYFTTYYAIDVVNFRPVNLSSALETIEGPYLPLVTLEAAGVPLDASFEEQKLILERCKGLFYGCKSGAEARRFNRLLIDAGLIKRL